MCLSNAYSKAKPTLKQTTPEIIKKTQSWCGKRQTCSTVADETETKRGLEDWLKVGTFGTK